MAGSVRLQPRPTRNIGARKPRRSDGTLSQGVMARCRGAPAPAGVDRARYRTLSMCEMRCARWLRRAWVAPAALAAIACSSWHTPGNAPPAADAQTTVPAPVLRFAAVGDTGMA